MDELIDIVTKTGLLTGKSALKSEIHAKGHYHNTAHIWLYTKKGEVLLAQRAASKIICPLLWDVSVAGHVDAGETITQAAIREVKEEIGLSILEKDLEKIGVFDCFQNYTNGIIDNEFHHTFITELQVDFSTLVYQNEEVEALKLVTISKFKTLLNNSENNHHFIASNYNYYMKVLDAIILKIH
ncbi:NUDIX domain-containing protein [Lacinutrix sp. C3R15]|uniref:NUDIX hydrolase n=1 Tax=Flavobacteriaceae TaxID=49546 RepID=UPI001C0A00F1|nr:MULTISPECIES: NUDIX domain-containing protein [Flavobacteriaceae]MBU2940357.1 NUDIX domain-containing protein [Lacinutrix sp. C3R15]MDO6623677.1 NUDIX domain-containing protein [Oceanihabitans sp. 1_MG-2023]